MPHQQKDPASAELAGPSQDVFLAGNGREATPRKQFSQAYRGQLADAAIRNIATGLALGGREGAALIRLANVYAIRAAGGSA